MGLISGKQVLQRAKYIFNEATRTQGHKATKFLLCQSVKVSKYQEVEGDNMDTKTKIREVLINLLSVKPQEIRDEVSLQECIGLDSTEMVESIIALEKAFGLKLSPKEITKFSSVNEIEENINSKLKK